MKKVFSLFLSLNFFGLFVFTGLAQAQTGNPYSCPEPRPILQQGASNPGTCVQAVQWYLDHNNSSPSGNFDAALTTAVRAWQTSHGLTPVDGIVGPKTWSSFTCVDWDNTTGTCKDAGAGPTPSGGTSADCNKVAQNVISFSGGTGIDPLAANCYSPGQAIAKAVNIGFTFAAILAVLFIIIGGYRYITSRGDEKKAGTGKQTIIWAVLGLGLVLLAYTVVAIVTRLTTTTSLF